MKDPGIVCMFWDLMFSALYYPVLRVVYVLIAGNCDLEEHWKFLTTATILYIKFC